MQPKFDREYALQIPPTGDFNKYVDTALDNDEISLDEWYEINNIYFTKLYLAADNPRAQSGNGGDEFHYFYTHLSIVEAIYKNGTFCDFGCANGHLLEMVHKWASGIGYDLQMFGVDISEGLIAFAQKRLPQWHDNFFIGNAYHCMPPQRFDYFHMRTLGFPKKENKRAVFNYLLENYLVDNGRMIIGPYWYENEDSYHEQLLEWGIPPTGYIIKTDYRKSSRLRKMMWIDKNSIE